jgi:hypothetical protein
MRSRAYVLAVVMTAGCGGISQGTHQKSLDELATCNSERGSCNTARDNQARRVERLEQELLAERSARIDDLAILVDLVSSGWSGVDERLRKLESGLERPIVPFRAEREDPSLGSSAADAA